MNENCIVPTVKHQIAGDFVQIKGMMQKEKYCFNTAEACNSFCLLLYWTKILSFNKIMIQNTAKKLCTNYLKSKEDEGILQIMTWPPQSPDLSLIQLVWDEIDCKVWSELPSK